MDIMTFAFEKCNVEVGYEGQYSVDEWWGIVNTLISYVDGLDYSG
jgi:hypothetical protein